MGDATQRTVANLLLTQLVWFACVLGGDAWAVAALLHLLIYRQWLGSDADWPLLGVVTAIGYGVDSSLATLGYMDYSAHTLSGLLPAPLWLAALWLSFATLFRHGLQWLQGRLWLAAALGAVAGPLTYYAGSQLGAATPGSSLTIFLLLHAALWAIMTPLFACLARRMPDATTPAT
jgi:hypothetical protein